MANCKVLIESEQAYELAARYVRAGKLVVIPGLTNYAFILNARDPAAIRRVYQLKGRSYSKPLTLLVPPHDAETYVVIPSWARGALCLMGEPIALVGRAVPGLDILTNINPYSETVGVFWLNIAVHKYLYHLTDCPIAGTSLNRSEQPVVRRGSDAVALFGNDVDLIINGGDVPHMHEGSTVLDVSTDPPSMLRAGMVELSTLRCFIPSLTRQADSGPEATLLLRRDCA